MYKAIKIMDNTKVQFLPGVGPRKAMLLQKLGIETIKDLITHYPSRYEDRGTFVSIANLRPNTFATIKGKLTSIENRQTKRANFILTQAILSDRTGSIVLTWFNQKYKLTELTPHLHKDIIVYGQVNHSDFGYQINSPKYELVKEEQVKAGCIVPIYPTTEGLTGDYIREIIHNVVKKHIDEIKENLPLTIREKYNLIGKKDAVRMIHFPKNGEEFEKARKRLVFEELFFIQLGFCYKRKINQVPGQGIAFGIPENYKKEIKEIIPFELTDAQKRSIKEILSDMRKNVSMNRLLQGDVGSGKTVVALAAMIFCIRNNYQATFMAPTEILASQHFMSLTNMINNYGICDINIVLLKGKQRSVERREALESIENGTANIVVGTHALLSEGVNFHKLGLVIIDEQHKFGVMQRATLKEKGLNPDVLVMTATPIPRTLTQLVYGDLSVSIIDQLPEGRKPIITHHKKAEDRIKVYNSLKSLLDMGEQAYVVCPLVEGNENIQSMAATDLYEELRDNLLSDYSVGLIHGKMKSDEKAQIMKDFRDGKIQVLVATIVIEVGVDVPSANTIIIEDASHFGLSQLHQLRGRVGRGGKQGFCILLGDPTTDEGEKRLKIMCQTNNGFKIAQEDLILRGPGEFTGTRQSGINNLKIADIFKDTDILEIAKEGAIGLVKSNPTLQGEEYLRKIIREILPDIDIASIS